MNSLKRFLSDETGTTLLEYGIIASLISVATMSGMSTLGNQLSTMFTTVASKK